MPRTHTISELLRREHDIVYVLQELQEASDAISYLGHQEWTDLETVVSLMGQLTEFTHEVYDYAKATFPDSRFLPPVPPPSVEEVTSIIREHMENDVANPQPLPDPDPQQDAVLEAMMLLEKAGVEVKRVDDPEGFTPPGTHPPHAGMPQARHSDGEDEPGGMYL